jgi:hypothetical protein
MTRLGWVVFEKGTDMHTAAAKLENQPVGEHTLKLAPHNTELPVRNRFISYDSTAPERLRHDAEQAKQLALHLDAECGIVGGCEVVKTRLDSVILPALAASGDPVKRTLDLYLEYLCRVHQYDYYTGMECASPQDFARRSPRSVRSSIPPPTPPRSKDRFADRVDSRVSLRIEQPQSGPAIIQRGGKSLDVQIDKTISLFVRKESESKFRCTECQKLFKAVEFVRKHIRGKHPNIIDEETVPTYPIPY